MYASVDIYACVRDLYMTHSEKFKRNNLSRQTKSQTSGFFNLQGHGFFLRC